MNPRTGHRSAAPLTYVPPIDDATRRQFVAGALASALFITSGSVRASSVPPPGTITTPYGTYEVPLDPQRVVLMGNRIDLETALALEMAPMAVGVEYVFDGGPTEWLPAWVPLDNPDDVHAFEAGDGTIEDMLTLRPDLIFCRGVHLDSDTYRGYENLSRVAPIVPVGTLPWREELVQVAGWLRRDAHLARTFAVFDALVDDITARHGDRIANSQVAYGSINEQGIDLRNLDDLSAPSQALQALGGHVLPFSGEADEGAFAIGPEALNEVDDADAVLFWSLREEHMDAFLANPLVEHMPADENERLTLVTNNVSASGVYTIIECLRIWDQVFATLA